MSLKLWKSYKRPNYNTNVDLLYPYSELPFTPQYKMLKLPVTGDFIEHVDYWGEGRITEGGYSSGFRSSYNVNRQYQAVSNGPDRDKKIPNRIPIKNENDCDTSAYIKDNSVKLVTLMGAPIIASSAKDIARIVNQRNGIVVIYSMPIESSGIKMLIRELKNKQIFYCPTYEASDYLKEPTLMDSHVAFLNDTLIKNELFKYVSSEDYDKAVTLSKSLYNDNATYIVSLLVDRLLLAKDPKVLAFANKVWSAGTHNLVYNSFHTEIGLIMNQDQVKLIGKQWNHPLKLDSQANSQSDRLALGDSTNQSNNSVSWKLIPVWEDKNLLFKIMNMEHNMYLKLDAKADSYGYGDRQVWGSNSSNEKSHLWKLIPVMTDEGLVFLIKNHEYELGLRLNAKEDYHGSGDTQAWCSKSRDVNNPKYFGWLIKAWQ